MARSLTQGDIRSWARLTEFWTPLRVTLARAAALAENRFVRASGNRHAKCAPYHEHYWTVEQIEKDLKEAGYVIMHEKALEELLAQRTQEAYRHFNPKQQASPAGDTPKRRGRPPKTRDMQQGAEEE